MRKHFGGKTDIKKSLKTKDIRIAKTSSATFQEEFQTFITGIRLGMLTEDDIKRVRSKIIGEVTQDLHSNTNSFGNLRVPMTEYGPRLMRYEWEPSQVLDALNSPERLDASFINEVRSMALSVEKKLRGNLLHPSVKTRAKNIARDLGLDVNSPLLNYSSEDDVTLPDNAISADFIGICTVIAKAAVDVILLEHGKILNLPNDEHAQRVSARYKEGLPEPHLSELWESYYQDKKSREAWSKATTTKNTDAYKVIKDIIGDPRVPECGSLLTQKLIDGLRHYPKNKNKYKEFRDVPFSMEMSKTLRFVSMAPSHINFHIELMSSIFKYARSDIKRWRIEQNPFENKQVADKSGKRPDKKKEAFSKEQIEKIFIELSKVRRIVEPEKFWVPLICFYSGMRINEACQLLTSDVEEHDGVPIFQVLENPEDDQGTKNDKNRAVPVHKVLIELGFLIYVQQQRKNKQERLFSNLEMSDEGKWHRKVDDWFNRTIVNSHLKLGEKVSFHSTKHSFINWFKQSLKLTWSDLDMLRVIVAHLDDSFLSEMWSKGNGITTQLYGKAYPMRNLQDFINKLDYGVDISLLQKKK